MLELWKHDKFPFCLKPELRQIIRTRHLLANHSNRKLFQCTCRNLPVQPRDIKQIMWQCLFGENYISKILACKTEMLTGPLSESPCLLTWLFYLMSLSHLCLKDGTQRTDPVNRTPYF